MQRLDKILSEAGVASRRELKDIIRSGRVSVNGAVVRHAEDKFDEKTAEIQVDGVTVRKKERVVLMLNKPAGFVTSTEDPRDPTVMELIPEEYRKLDVKPVGRLDKETEGLLLFTNDGALAHHMITPKMEVWKTYYAEHDGEVSDEDIQAFCNGIELKDGSRCLPAQLECLEKGKSLIRVQEGKYHQVRRMMASRGMPIAYLKRIAEGSCSLGQLPVGACRELSAAEIRELTGENAQEKIWD